jgi:hypothetical protein
MFAPFCPIMSHCGQPINIREGASAGTKIATVQILGVGVGIGIGVGKGGAKTDPDPDSDADPEVILSLPQFSNPAIQNRLASHPLNGVIS